MGASDDAPSLVETNKDLYVTDVKPTIDADELRLAQMGKHCLLSLCSVDRFVLIHRDRPYARAQETFQHP